MDTVKQVTLIETKLTRRGEGTQDSPVRVITQYWSQEGDLVIEHDPCSLRLTHERRKAIRAAVIESLGENDKAANLLTKLEEIYSQ